MIEFCPEFKRHRVTKAPEQFQGPTGYALSVLISTTSGSRAAVALAALCAYLEMTSVHAALHVKQQWHSL